jgi:hypothetical protein
MYVACWKAQIAVLLLTIAGGTCWAVPVPPFRLDEITAQSDVIGVFDVGQARPSGSGVISLAAQTVPANRFEVTANLVRILKGSCDNTALITYELPATGESLGFRDLGSGVKLLFLRHRSGDVFSPSTPYYPALPAVRNYQGSSQGTVKEKIVSELGRVVASGDEPSIDRETVLGLASAIPPDEAFTASLRDAIATSSHSPDFMYRILGNLMRRKDLTVLPDVTRLLLSSTLPKSARSMFEYVIGNSVADPRAIPSLEPLLHSHYSTTRSAAVQALWHIGTWSAVPGAILGLRDSDPHVRYYAIRALSAVTGELEWGPSIPEFEAHEGKYVQHWTEWASNFGSS